MSNQIISEQEILNVQKAWGEGIIKIGITIAFLPILY
mgnify:CR=1 FL=1